MYYITNLILDGENGYRKAVDTLNTICNAYVNSNATSGRSIGCTNNSIGTVTETIEAGISGLPYVDSYDETDLEQLSEKALLENGSVWLASRSISTINANVICCIKVVEYNNTGYNYDRACIFEGKNIFILR